MQVGVVTFPGSNCDRDVLETLEKITGSRIHKLWHKEVAVPKLDVIVLPGGFSYGDYLRCGAMASRSLIMKEVHRHAERGGYVIGICNGFQILTESKLLPGALLSNQHLKFVSKPQNLRVENSNTFFTKKYKHGEVINFPIAHHDGNYYIDDEGLKELQDNEMIIFRYCDESGKVSEHANPNGAKANIAGICNEKKNVLGLMPHPERHSDIVNGGIDGKKLFESLLESIG